ncbi:hypothetical protein RND71_025239 [Anisodus tanguticus]|uniref:Disease resistance R13L4/SHOC-2-like LRR domain-containing protein n=1 Tax=Anisodus tanguticus TaxID=243964 RepID=A0AAE1RSN5_9SOLA|nr:hypothetical protein RND71_025239 [Anisodus tanguticus]
MKPLPEDESQILFYRKAFSGSLLYPPSLVQVSKEIIEKCNGLPLEILAIAGALATKWNKIEAWELFYELLVDKLQVNKLPIEILKLQHLRHVLIYHFGAGFLHGFDAPKKIGTLVSLKVVNLINATTSTVIELGNLTRLRKLDIAELRRKYGRDLCSSLDKLINFEQLSISSYGVSDIIDLQYPLHSTHSSLRTLTFEGRLERLPIWVTSLQALVTVHLKLSKLEDNALRNSS